jgi:hypothetical protein
MTTNGHGWTRSSIVVLGLVVALAALPSCKKKGGGESPPAAAAAATAKSPPDAATAGAAAAVVTADTGTGTTTGTTTTTTTTATDGGTPSAEELAAKPCWNGTGWVARSEAPGTLAGDAARCGQVGTKALMGTPLSLLGDRLTVRPPEGAREEPREGSVMGAPEPSETETRVFYEADGEKLVLMAWEELRLAGERFDAAVHHVVESWEPAAGTAYCVEPLGGLPAGLRAYAVVPTQIGDEGEALPVLSVYTAPADGLVQLVRLYINPPLRPDSAGCVALAKRIAATLAPGARTISLAGGKRRLDAYSETKELELTMPENYVVTPQPGPDFAVHRIEPVAPLDQGGGLLGIYFGDNPQAPPGDWAGEVQRYQAQLLGREVEWVTWVVPASEEGPEQHHAEALRPLDDFPGGTRFMHAFIITDDAERLTELKDVLRTLQIVDKVNR